MIKAFAVSLWEGKELNIDIKKVGSSQIFCEKKSLLKQTPLNIQYIQPRESMDGHKSADHNKSSKNTMKRFTSNVSGHIDLTKTGQPSFQS